MLSKFSEGYEEVSDLPQAHVQLTAVCDMNICHVKEPVLGIR
jgi:hypothetical protein